MSGTNFRDILCITNCFDLLDIYIYTITYSMHPVKIVVDKVATIVYDATLPGHSNLPERLYMSVTIIALFLNCASNILTTNII